MKKNLQTEKYKFSALSPEIAQKNQLKSAQKRHENKLMRDVAAEKLLKTYNGKTFQDLTIEKIMNYCLSDDADSEKVLKILTFLRDTSGQKPKEEPQIVNMPVIQIKGL